MKIKLNYKSEPTLSQHQIKSKLYIFANDYNIKWKAEEIIITEDNVSSSIKEK